MFYTKKKVAKSVSKMLENKMVESESKSLESKENRIKIEKASMALI